MLMQTLKRDSWYNFYVDMWVKMSKRSICRSFETVLPATLHKWTCPS